MLTSDFDFPFPPSQIALRPLPRGEARLMVLSATDKAPTTYGQARDLVDILQPGDALVLNDTKVLRARLHGTLESGGSVEVLLLKPVPSRDADAAEAADDADGTGSEASGAVWECMARPGKKLQPGRRIVFSHNDDDDEARADALSAEVIEVLPEGERVLRFNQAGASFYDTLERIGNIPLPPYIQRDADDHDAETYQTVFAANPGSVAAPTASLHLSQDMLAALESKGVRLAKVTLHVGAGTFRPVQAEQVEDHPMHTEAYTLPAGSARILNETRERGGRIVAVGTTAARVLETCADEAGVLHAQAGETGIFIYPGYRWKAVDGLLTNFHWPQSTLFMLVAARLCGDGTQDGTARAKAAYANAIARGFRLFSYGDGMLILD